MSVKLSIRTRKKNRRSLLRLSRKFNNLRALVLQLPKRANEMIRKMILIQTKSITRWLESMSFKEGSNCLPGTKAQILKWGEGLKGSHCLKLP